MCIRDRFRDRWHWQGHGGRAFMSLQAPAPFPSTTSHTHVESGHAAQPSTLAGPSPAPQEAAMAKTVVIVGALDTKGEDFRYVKELIEGQGVATLVVDFGVMGPPAFAPDITREAVVAAAGGDFARITSGDHKDEAMQTMAAGLAAVVSKLYAEGKVDGIMGMGGLSLIHISEPTRPY